MADRPRRTDCQHRAVDSPCDSPLHCGIGRSNLTCVAGYINAGIRLPGAGCSNAEIVPCPILIPLPVRITELHDLSVRHWHTLDEAGMVTPGPTQEPIGPALLLNRCGSCLATFSLFAALARCAVPVMKRHCRIAKSGVYSVPTRPQDASLRLSSVGNFIKGP